MHYYVDGYNLLFRSLRASSADDDLKAKREEFIDELEKKVTYLNIDVTVVFDSQYQLGDFTRAHKKQLEIIYTAKGETADDFIISELKSEIDRHHQTVVTSDKKLAWRARRCLALTESVEEFMDKLEKRVRNKQRYERENKTPLEKKVEERIEQIQSQVIHQKSETELDYYLKAFAMAENLFQEKKQTQPIKKIKESEKTDREETEEERWERIFQEKLKNKDGA